MADVVEKEDINEALRLMEMSKQSLYEEETGSQYVNYHPQNYNYPHVCCGTFGITIWQKIKWLNFIPSHLPIRFYCCYKV